MPAKKIQVKVLDEDGNRYTITFEGKVTKQKALCLLDIVELIGGLHEQRGLIDENNNSSKFAKTKSVVEEHFRFAWFSSKEVLATYEQACNEPISLSTVSTYLARMADRGFVIRRGTPHKRRYRMVTGFVESILTTDKR